MTGGRPACSVTRADAVLTSVRAGELERPPEMTRRGLPRPPIPSRTIVAIACVGERGRAREASSPSATVSAAVGRDEDQRPLEERGGHVSLSREPPRELDERSCPRRVVSMAAACCRDGRRGRSPPRTALARSSRCFEAPPRRGRRDPRSRRPPRRSARAPTIVSLYQRAAPAASSVPGTREGNSVESSVATRGRDGGVEQRIEGRPRKCSCCRDREQERECCRHDDERADPDEARVERSRDGTPPPPPSRASRFHRGAIVGGQAARRARPPLRCRTPRPFSSSTTRNRSRPSSRSRSSATATASSRRATARRRCAASARRTSTSWFST